MEVQFGAGQVPANDVAAAPAAAQTQTAPVAPAPSQLPAVQSNFVLGDKIPTFSEVILPRINLAQNIGELKNTFDPGTVVFNQATALFVPGSIGKDGNLLRAPTKPVILTVLGFRPTRFVEKVAGGGRGAIVNTEAEVRACGGTLDFGEWNLKKASGMKRFEPMADALVAVQRPDIAIPEGSNPTDDDPVFVYDVDGKKFALGFWAMRGTSYTSAAKKVFFTARYSGCLRKGGYPSWSYALSTREESYPGGNKAWIPICVPNAASTPAFLEWAKSVLNPEQAQAAEPAN